jgi:hypothetical protein
MMSSLPPNISRYGPNHDPYLDNFVPDLRAIAPAANFEMGFKTDPSVMALTILSKNKSEKDAQLAKDLLKEIKEIFGNVLETNLIGDGNAPSVADSIIQTNVSKWLEKPHVVKAMEELGLSPKKTDGRSTIIFSGSDSDSDRVRRANGTPPVINRPPVSPTDRDRRQQSQNDLRRRRRQREAINRRRSNG